VKTSAPILELLELYKKNKINRNQYWLEITKEHNRLSDYQKAIKKTRIHEIHINRSHLILILDNRIKIAWDPIDVREAANITVNHGDYERKEREILESIAKNSKVIFDIGANSGWYSLHLQKQMAKNGKVFAFEPIPTTFKTLKYNIELNKLNDKVLTHNFALSDHAGKSVMFVPNFSGTPAASFAKLHKEENNIKYDCKLEKLDSFVDAKRFENIDLIKCDVEGAELMVLKGGRKTIETFRPVIFLEILRKWSKAFGYHPNDVINFLGDLQYKCWGIVGTKLIPHKIVNEKTIATNYLFAIPKTHKSILKNLGMQS